MDSSLHNILSSQNNDNSDTEFFMDFPIPEFGLDFSLGGHETSDNMGSFSPVSSSIHQQNQMSQSQRNQINQSQINQSQINQWSQLNHNNQLNQSGQINLRIQNQAFQDIGAPFLSNEYTPEISLVQPNGFQSMFGNMNSMEPTTSNLESIRNEVGSMINSNLGFDYNMNDSTKQIQEAFQRIQNMNNLQNVQNLPNSTNINKFQHSGDHNIEKDDSSDDGSEELLYEVEHDGQGQKRMTRPQKKRKIQSRVKRACLACRRSHVGCDAVRPCKRCLKKGIPCIDSEESEVAFAFNNTLPVKRKPEKEPELLNDTDSVSWNSKISPSSLSHDEGQSVIPMTSESESSELKQLKKIVQNQQQMITLLMSQMQIQSQDVNELKMRLEIQPRIHCTLFHSVPHGPWNNFSESKDHGIFVFKNDESQQLLGFNTAMARWKQIDEVDLKTGDWSWWRMSERQILPKSILCLVRSGHRSLYFNFKVLTKYNKESEVRVSIHVEEQVWWLVIDFSLCGSEPHRVTCLPQQTCPLKRERIEKECKEDVANGFSESMNILLGPLQDKNSPQEKKV